MSTVTRENIGTLHDKITVKISKTDYSYPFEKTLRQQTQSITMPGFRKGKAPAGMVKKMYGQSIFTDIVLRTASRKLEEYLGNEKLAIFAQPMPLALPTHLDMNADDDVDLEFEVGLKPEFEITALTGRPKLTHYNIAVSDKMMDDELGRIAQRFGKTVDQEVIGHKEDLISATFEEGDAAGKIEEYAHTIEDVTPLEKFPVKLQELLMGKHVNDSFVFVPGEVCTEEELADMLKNLLKRGEEVKKSHYKLTVKHIGQLVPHELNTELYLQVFPNEVITTEADFRERISKELSKEFARIANDRMNNDIYELLVHNTAMQLPVPFLKRWMKEGGEKPKTDREVEHEFGGFDHQLRWTLISDKLIIENNIQVSREEVMQDIKTKVLGYFGLDADDDAPWMESYMTKVMKEEKTVDETYRRLLFDKLFVFLHSQFEIEEKEVSEEEFFKIPDAHGHHHHH